MWKEKRTKHVEMFHSYHDYLWFSEGTPQCQSPASAELAPATNQPHEMKSEATGKTPALQRGQERKNKEYLYLFPEKPVKKTLQCYFLSFLTMLGYSIWYYWSYYLTDKRLRRWLSTSGNVHIIHCFDISSHYYYADDTQQYFSFRCHGSIELGTINMNKRFIQWEKQYINAFYGDTLESCLRWGNDWWIFFRLGAQIMSTMS